MTVQCIKDFMYQTLQFGMMAPAAALVGKNIDVNRFIPTFETISNLNSWHEKALGTWGSLKAMNFPKALANFDFNPMSEENLNTVKLAATIGIVTAGIFQVFRSAPRCANHPKITFLYSTAVTIGLVALATEINMLPIQSDVVYEVAKNVLTFTVAITVAAKTLKVSRQLIHPVVNRALNFVDILSSVNSNKTTTQEPVLADETQQ